MFAWIIAFGFLLFLIFFGAFFVTRIIIVIREIKKRRLSNRIGTKRRKTAIKTMIVAGSGGHTMEILQLVNSLGDHYSPRCYVIAKTDTVSEAKIIALEKQMQEQGRPSNYTVHQTPRSREVGQSWLTSLLTTAYSCFVAFPLIFKTNPDLILCNGPGTCVPLCYAAFLFKVIGFRKTSLVFVESFCRVNTLSLSGRLLYPIADHMLVQWPDLLDAYPATKYLARLV